MSAMRFSSVKECTRIVSILEIMKDYKVADLAYMLSSVTLASRDLSTSDQLNQPISDDDFMRQVGIVLDGLRITCHLFEADPTLLSQMERLSTELVSLKADRRAAVLATRLDAILDGVKENLKSRKFLFLPVDNVMYWENQLLFGQSVLLVFERQAIDEIREAGSCYAAERYTACVFHCMRVAEYGLRMLARNLRVTVSDRNKKIPIEYGDWNKVIIQIKGKIAAARLKPQGKQKEESLNFYSNSVDHCEYMKDIWRNEVSHARRLYNRAEAFAVMSRVREFMNLIAIKNAKRRIRGTSEK